MAGPFLNNGVGVKVNSIDLSDHVTNVSINRNFDELEVTAMGDSGHRFIKGLEASSVTLDFLNDTATASVLQTLNSSSVWGNNIVVKFVQDRGSGTPTISATNPLYTMTCLINGTTPINGATGDLSTQSVTWNVSGTIAVTDTGTF
jgi:hypothetical protein